MVIKFDNWKLVPYATNGMRCWQVYRAKRSDAECYHSTLGAALRWCAEYSLRNDEEGTVDLDAALNRYEAICERIENVVCATSTRG